MALRTRDARLLMALSMLGLTFVIDIGKSFALADEVPVSADGGTTSEPSPEDQLIQSTLRILKLQKELRIAEQRIETLSSKRPGEREDERTNTSQYMPLNGREEICVESILQALRNEDVSIDWALSCGEKLIGRIVASEGAQKPGAEVVGPDPDTGLSSPEFRPADQSGGESSGTSGGRASDPAEIKEPYIILSGEDGETPLMRQQRDVSDMKAELLSSSECIEAGKWLVSAAQKDLLLFSFFAVDGGQIGRCVQTNSGWRFERAGPFDEGYVLRSTRKS